MVVAACYFPALEGMLAAASGEGCQWNGREARVSSVESLGEALVSLTESGSLDVAHRGFLEKLKAKADTIRGYCDCYGHALVATGSCEVMLDPVMNPWDCGALLPIVEEAGGSFTDWSGRKSIYGGSAVSTNGSLFDDVMALSELGSVE